ncbi:MAG: PD40 domain-containing protein [Ardenticatenaceae bacterium]|nr:PD40 domain-containing protein [Ardenticatenaceae bacterium]MCB9444223.1 PD40 domain-containing protein [Ardenticatenaceae bacterium]
MTWAQFRRLISQHFDVEELRTLCFDLNVDYDALRGDGKEAKVRELAALFRRNGRLPELLDALTNMRPLVPWQELTTGGRAGSSPGRQHQIIGYAAGTIVILAVAAILIFQSLKPKTDEGASTPSAAVSGDGIVDIVPEALGTAVTGQIVFSRYPADDPNKPEICIWTAVTKQVACLKLAGRFPVWSPDGSQILFINQSTTRLSDIFTARADGTQSKVLPIPDTYTNPREPDWSPDGQSLVFITDGDTEAGLYRLNLSDNQVTQITTNPNTDFNPDWSSAFVSPAKILFVSWFGEPLLQGIYTIDPTSPAPEETRQLLFSTASINEIVASPTWSPTEERFAFIYENVQTEICTMPAIAGEKPVCFAAAVDDLGMDWSPNGRYIAYTAHFDNTTQIRLLDPSTGESFMLLEQENYWIAGFSWKS